MDVMACKAVNGKCRAVVLLPEEEFRVLEQVAEQAGLSVSAVIRMKLKGIETTRKAA
jgi:hypothetical protein